MAFNSLEYPNTYDIYANSFNSNTYDIINESGQYTTYMYSDSISNPTIGININSNNISTWGQAQGSAQWRHVAGNLQGFNPSNGEFLPVAGNYGLFLIQAIFYNVGYNTLTPTNLYVTHLLEKSQVPGNILIATSTVPLPDDANNGAKVGTTLTLVLNMGPNSDQTPAFILRSAIQNYSPTVLTVNQIVCTLTITKLFSYSN